MSQILKELQDVENGKIFGMYFQTTQEVLKFMRQKCVQ
jgi:hypothetical protein